MTFQRSQDHSLPIELMAFAQAKPGQMLVERVEMPARRGKILLPYATREYNRAAEGVIRSSFCDGFCSGQVVVMTGTVSRFMHFGDGESRKTLWICRPEQILLRLDEVPDEKVSVGEDHWQRNVTSEQYEYADVEGVDEGEAWSKIAT